MATSRRYYVLTIGWRRSQPRGQDHDETRLDRLGPSVGFRHWHCAVGASFRLMGRGVRIRLDCLYSVLGVEAERVIAAMRNANDVFLLAGVLATLSTATLVVWASFSGLVVWY